MIPNVATRPLSTFSDEARPVKVKAAALKFERQKQRLGRSGQSCVLSRHSSRCETPVERTIGSSHLSVCFDFVSDTEAVGKSCAGP